MNRAIIPVLAVLAIIVVSGCIQQAQEAIPKDEKVTLTGLPLPAHSVDTGDCARELLAKYPDASQYQCFITQVDIPSNEYSCQCNVHSGIL